jgi:hypothetical protein
MVAAAGAAADPARGSELPALPSGFLKGHRRLRRSFDREDDLYVLEFLVAACYL